MKNEIGFKGGLRGRLLAGSVLSAMMAVVPMGIAQAQEVERVAQAEEDDAVQETVVITGSRLNTNPNLLAVQPVLSVDASEIDSRGAVRIEELTNILPQVFAGQTSEVSNGATGTSSLDLRGLGAVRTLTLIDGKRLPLGASTSVAVNLDLIPTQLVERVDILTGGASAVYGSDAVAGVANFVLRDDFEGLEIDVQGGFAQSGNGVEFFDNVLAAADLEGPGGNIDGEELFISGIFGANTADGRGNVTLFGSYEVRNEISQADRSISACALGQDDGAQSFGGVACVGSANFRLFGGPGGFTFQEEDGNIIPFVGGPAQTFNFGPFNFFQRPSERFQIYSKARYDITDSLEAYLDVGFTNNSTDAQIAPTASFGIGAFSINCDNPLIQGNTGTPFTDIFGCSAADIAAGTVVDGITASHRNVEGGPRNSSIDNTAWRIVTGLRGDINDLASYEVFGQFSRTADETITSNDFVTANVQQAFLATTDANGDIVCTDTSGGCVPFNLFQRTADGQSLITQEQLDFVQGTGITTGETQQIVLGANIQSDLGQFGLKSPLTDAGVGVLVGYEFREDSLQSVPDEISQIEGGGFTGVGGATLAVSGELDVHEVFTEIQVPLVTEQPFVRELVLSGEYRFSSYEVSNDDTSNDFDTHTYGVELAYAPTEDVRLRGQFQRAVRAPNVVELFTGQNSGLPNLVAAGTNANGVQLFDPCASDAPIATLAQCMNTGVTAAQFGNILDVISGQTQSITGGNPDLDPEESDTFTVGAVVTPRFAPGLVLSVDYFDISIDDAIVGGIAPQTALDECLATGDPAFCGLITRSAAGSLAAGGFGIGFQQTNINLAEISTAGIDLQIRYGFDAADFGLGNWGNFSVDYAGTFLTEFDIVNFPGADVDDCAGFFQGPCGLTPDYRHRLLATWNTPWDVSLTNTWRYFGGVTNQPSPDDPIDGSIGTEQYWDISANYAFSDNLNFRAGVLNLLDNKAPAITSAGPALGNGNTFPGTFDTSRFVFVGATISF